MFVWNLSGCSYTIGKAQFDLNLGYQGAKNTWQVLSLSDGCAKDYNRVMVQHMILHVLGMEHEQKRPDRDNFINVYPSRSYSPAESFSKLNSKDWQQTKLGARINNFELDSIMMTCSMCSAKDHNKPIMTMKNGDTWSTSNRLTTADALTVQWKYCRNFENFSYKETADCKSKDQFGFKRKVFSDRICDGIGDCPQGEDETGHFGECNSGGVTPNGCCNSLRFNVDDVCTADGTMYNERNVFKCDSHPDHMIVFVFNNWLHVTSGMPSAGIQTFFDASTDSDNTCPPLGKWVSTTWPSLATIKVFCATPQEDHCTDNDCDTNAACKTVANTFQCTCKNGYSGNGKTCTENSIINECLSGSHDCHEHADCTDTSSGWNCQCKTGYTDMNKNNPGQLCTIPCDAGDIDQRYPIKGNGQWNCSSNKKKRTCKITCENGTKRNSQVTCSFKKDTWVVKPNRNPFACISSTPLCLLSQIDSVYQDYVDKLKSPYQFDESDFVIKTSKKGFKATYKCDETTVTKKVQIKCTIKKNVEYWHFKGNPSNRDCVCN